MGCHFLLQGIFSTQGSNQGLLQADSLLAELQGKLHDMVSTGKREEQQQLINDFVLIFL